MKQNNYLGIIILFAGSILALILLINLKFSLQTVSASTASVTDSLSAQGVVLENKPYIMIWKTADWCGLCAASREEVQEAADTYNNNLQLVEIDADVNPVLSEMIHANNIPTLAVYKRSGELVGEIDLTQKQDIVSAIGLLVGFN